MTIINQHHTLQTEIAIIPNHIVFIEYLADKLLITSFFLNKMKDLPLGPICFICLNLGVTCLALAYSLQSISSLYYIDTKPRPDFWNYSRRAFIFNLLGGLTAWACILFPELWLIGSWIFCLNNLIWVFNEHSRLESTTYYPAMPKNHSSYCHYVSCICLAVFTSTLGFSFNFNAIATALNWLITCLGIYFLYQSVQDNNPALSVNQYSGLPADLKYA